MVSAAIPGSSLGAPKPPGSGCTIAPQLRDITINQGLGSYTRLVRGKETLVRAYLSLPSCAGTGAAIRLLDGQLTVAGGGGGGSVPHPTPTPTFPFPVLAPFTQAAMIDAPADAKFVVPPSLLAPASNGASYTASFQITLQYEWRATSSAAFQTTQAILNTRPGTTLPITATVERTTNALRVLVVPMGDATLSYASQFSATANAAVQEGMLTLSRIFPVANGTSELIDVTRSAGVRYTISPTLLDVGRLMVQGKFCLNGTTFDGTVKGLLAQFLLSWNAANPNAPADRVVGVIDEAISLGGSAGCYEGVAVPNGTEAVVRAFRDVAPPGTPSMTGALLAMELSHTLGDVPLDRDHAFSPRHSPLSDADGGTNRAYNVRLRSFLADDRTVMTLSGTWNNATTVLEQLDYAFLLCKLGGSIAADCASAPGSVGSTQGVAAGSMFVVSGTTNGTEAGTKVVESFSATEVIHGLVSTGPYRVEQTGPGLAPIVNFFRVEFAGTHHDDGDVPGHTLGEIAFAVPLNGNTNRVELYNGSTFLHRFDKTMPPTLESVSVSESGEEINYTNDLNDDDTWPAVSANGLWMAWAGFQDGDGPRIHVAPIGDSDPDSTTVLGQSVDTGETQPAWSPDGGALAYIGDGDLLVRGVDFSSGTPEFDPVASTLVSGDSEEEIFPAHPTWSPDGDEIAFDMDGDIWIIARDGEPGSEENLTETPFLEEHSPSWSQTDDDDRIAFVREVPEPLIASISLASIVRPSDGARAAPADHPGTVSEFTVTTAADEADAGEPCDGTGNCSLREAIVAADLSPGRDAIHFEIVGTAPFTIALTAALPVIDEAVVIDASTQDGSVAGTPLVAISGADVPPAPGLAGLIIAGGDSEIRGLAIHSFPSAEGIILRDGSDPSNGGGNVVAGNFLGINLAGDTAAPNGTNLRVETDDNTIGGIDAAVIENPDRNVVSGSNAGIVITGDDNVVVGNYIGTDAAGTAAIGNAFGVILAGTGNAIGDPDAPLPNVISGNIGPGIDLSGNSNSVVANYVGTDYTGLVAVPNTVGIQVNASSGNTVGGVNEADRNIISGNSPSGVRLFGSADGNTVQGNYIGLDINGAGLGNSVGVDIQDATGYLVGGTGAGATNVISANLYGVTILGGSANTVAGNLIGTDPSGVVDVGNAADGVNILLSDDNVIGGTTPEARNVISGNGGGVFIDDASSSGNQVQGNYVGLDALGTTAMGNDGHGVWIRSAIANAIGGSVAGAGNHISGNGNAVTAPGIRISGITATDNTVLGNFIGVDANGSAVGNAFQGIQIDSEAQKNVIGGDAAGEPNVIANNGDDGIEVVGTGNLIQGNQVYENADLGIDLGANGVTPNDVGDDDSGGGNDFMNFPEVTSATSDGVTTSIAGVLDSQAMLATPTIDLYASDACDPSGNGEGQTYLGSTVITPGLDETGHGTWAFDAGSDQTGRFVTATATDTYPNTSEFSACLEVTAAPVSTTAVVNVADDLDDTVCDGTHCSLREALLTFGVERIEFAIPGSGPQTITVGSPLPFVGAIEIDGTTQDGYAGTPLIEIDGSGLVDDPEGFDYGLILTGGATVRALAVNAFPDGGIGMWVADDNRLESSYVGLKPDGTTPAGNGGPGVQIIDSSANTIGGLGVGNVIADNEDYGIQINPQSADNVIEGNYVGLNAAGDAGLGNGTYGIYIVGSTGNVIGGTDEDARNVIADNIAGIKLLDDDEPTDTTRIEGNYIGTDASGTVAIPNEVGISISASSNIVGGTAAGAGNIVSGNNQDGIDISQFEGEVVTGNQVQGNRIGVGSDGELLGNGQNGISIDASQNLIGGITPEAANVIANNAINGVVVRELNGPANGNTIQGNSIYDSGLGLGIDLGGDGITPNDDGDFDSSSNQLQNFPEVSSATGSGSETNVAVSLGSAPLGSYLVELFVNGSCNPFGSGEGEALVDQFVIDTDVEGLGAADRTLDANHAGSYLTATATDVSGNTSEFSACTLVTAAPVNLVVNTEDDTVNDGCDLVHCTLREAIEAANAPFETLDLIRFDIPGTAPFLIQPETELPPITDPVEIDGTSQPGFATSPIVQVDGALISDSGDVRGLQLAPGSGGSTIRGLSITGFLGDSESGDSLGIALESSGNDLVGNYIGLDPTGAPAGNGRYGLLITGSGNLIGGSTDADRNVISANDFIGIGIFGPGDTGQGNAIYGNYVGTDPGGTLDRGNGSTGIYISAAAFNTIGADTEGGPGTGNVISGNGEDGILIAQDFLGEAANDTSVDRNRIGTDLTGTVAIGNDEAGIAVVDAVDSRIGGSSAASGNQISGNAAEGVLVIGTAATGTQITGNLIGTAGDGTTPLGNGGDGVQVDDASLSSIVSNVIRSNGGNGVGVLSGTGNAIQLNAIDANVGLGIDLGADGVTENDFDQIDTANYDLDSGANDLQNFPDIDSALTDGIDTRVDGSLGSTDAGTFRIQAFAVDTCDASTNGEGMRLVGEAEVTDTDGDGFVTYSITGLDLAGDAGVGDFVTTIATNAATRNSSEFSDCVAIEQFTAPSIYTMAPDPDDTPVFLVNGTSPSWGPDNVVGFARDGDIWGIQADGGSSEQFTNTPGEVEDHPSLVRGIIGFERLFDNPDDGTDVDIWLITSRQLVTIAVSDPDNADQLQIDLNYRCPAVGGLPAFDHILAVALAPFQVQGTSALWSTNFDPTLTCKDGTLFAIGTDTFTRTNAVSPPANETQAESGPKQPVAAILAPLLGQQFLEWQSIPLHGSGKDADDGELTGTSLQWTVDGNAAGTGNSPGDFPPLPPSADPYLVQLTVTDLDGQTDTASAQIFVIADTDHDGLPDVVESECGDPNNAFDAFGDDDGDGYNDLNDYAATDEGPCEDADFYPATATFDPQTLFVPSSGTSVTMTVRVPLRNLTAVDGSTVRLTEISGADVSTNPLFLNTGWSVRSGVGTAKFSRKAINDFLLANHMVGGKVWFTIEGTAPSTLTSPAWSFQGSASTNASPS